MIEVAADYGISEGMAYRIIKQLNCELEEKGYITVAGRVSRKYYLQRTYNEDVNDILHVDNCFAEGE